MKVLYLVSGIGPPAGWGTEFIQNLIFELSKKRIQAIIINPIYIHTPSSVISWTREQEKKYDIRIVNIRLPRLFDSLHCQLAITPIYTTLASVKLLSQEKFNLIHEFSSTPIVLFRIFLFNILFHTSTVFTLGVYNNTILGRLFWIKLFDFAKYYMVPSHELIDKIKSLGVSSRKLIYCPPGINPTRFRKKMNKNDARKKLGLPQNKFIFVYYGSLTREKGVYDLIQSVQSISKPLRKRILIALFAIWKGSKEHQKIKNLIRSINLPHIKLVEKYVDIPTLLSATDTVVLPQQTGHGATIPPISIIEALLNKSYIITTKTVGVDTCVDKRNGILLAPNQPIVLSQAIKRVYKEKRKNSISEKKYKILSKAFDINNSVKLHKSIYSSFVADANS